MALLMLTESKRDDLLIPYFNLVKDKMPELTLGKFKGVMLDKLVAQGCMNNLSLGSNFYLAGATRYYFEGALTTDGQAHMLSGDPRVPDNWNEDVCKKVNALIGILRNSYIDSIGTQFEQPEDFGNLPLNKLLRKYGKKIATELGLSSGDDEKKEKKDELNRDNHVGNDYTFDILYNYSQATKYERATAPGSWCITYGQCHFDGYVRRLNIHYVIFLKNGYENVPRQTGPGYSRQKPHDEYGNSMIALLQSNNDWRPVYITSRWNHGHGETCGTEADHAYTLEEFCQITGVTPEDLQRIYTIWKTDKKNYGVSTEETVSKAEVKKSVLDITRKLKYAQMVINTGANVLDALANAGVTSTPDVLYGNGDLKKSIASINISDNNADIFFLMDRGKILFDSFVINNDNERWPIRQGEGLVSKVGGNGCPIVFISKGNNKCMVYNGRFHEFLSINGVSIFKKTPSNSTGNRDSDTAAYFEVKNGFKDIALVSVSDGRPLRLPNGDYWFNSIKTCGDSWQSKNEIHCNTISQTTPVIKITYDESSGEAYFFNVVTKKFMEFDIVNHDRPEMNYYSYAHDRIAPEDYEITLNRDFRGMKGYFSMYFVPEDSGWYSNHTKPLLFNINGQQVSIYGMTKFKNLHADRNRFISFAPDNDNDAYVYYDTVTKKMVAIGDKLVKGNYSEMPISSDAKVYFIDARNGGAEWNNGTAVRNSYFAYDAEKGLIIKNPVGYPNETVFKIETRADKRFFFDDFDYWDYVHSHQTDGMGWWERSEAAKKEQAKHTKTLDEFDYECFPNDFPVNNENEVETQQAPQPAYSLNEERIREIVAETLRNIME